LPQRHSDLSVPVYSIEGKKLKDEKLPAVFSTEFEPELIKRAVLAMQTAAKQPQGTKKLAGRDNTAQYRGCRDLPTAERGINVGKARLPRLNNRSSRLSGRVASIPRAVGGPKAHPPKVEKKHIEKINKKEKKKAFKSALACTTDFELVSARHRIEKIQLPFIVEDKFETIAKTQEVIKALEALGLKTDLDNAKDKTKRRSGKGKKRGRIKKIKKSLLIVTGKKSAVYKAARNLPGVEISIVKELNSELLAPGGQPGRLTVFTESAIAELK